MPSATRFARRASRNQTQLFAVSLAGDLETIADETGFSGVAAVSNADGRIAELSRGLANRAYQRANTLETQFATASATKSLTALAVGSLIETSELSLETQVRNLLGARLPLIDPAVTIAHLLSHTSGVGDYLDEEQLVDVDDYVFDMGMHRLANPADYIPLLDGHKQRSPPGARFAYNNSGYVMLSIAVEAATGRSFYDVVHERVLEPAGMADTGFFRSDNLPSAAAIGYLANGRTNVFHLPVRGAGDGGAFSTLADIETLWAAVFSGRILPTEIVEKFVEPRSTSIADNLRYGMGFWLGANRLTVMLEGMDAGVSFRSAYDRPTGAMYTVMSNTSSGAWPIVKVLDEQLPLVAGA